MGTFSESAGITRTTAQRYRELHEAMQAKPDDFAGLVAQALDAGRPVPLGKLRSLLAEEPLPQRETWLGGPTEVGSLPLRCAGYTLIRVGGRAHDVPGPG